MCHLKSKVLDLELIYPTESLSRRSINHIHFLYIFLCDLLEGGPQNVGAVSGWIPPATVPQYGLYWLLEGSVRLPERGLREASHHCEEDEQHREAEAHGHRRLSE